MKRFFEVTLSLTLIFAILCGARADARQASLADKMLRLHVIANSDSNADQEEKLRVRDRVLRAADELIPDTASLTDVKRITRENLDTLTAAAKTATDLPVRAEVCTMYFPTREYDTFTLPAGEYDALRIIIGNGAGRNWWCVLFPPLCVSAAQAVGCAEEAGLSEEELQMISRGETVYRYEFKFLEILSKLKEKLI